MNNDLIPLGNHERLRRKWRRRATLRKQKKAIFGVLGSYGIYNVARLILGLVIAVIFVLSFSAAVLSIGLPSPTNLTSVKSLESTRVLDRNGVVLYDIYGDKRRSFVSLADIPDDLKHATISAEDKDFYFHAGFDIRGLIRGVIIKPLLGSRAQGGSTITQQLVKNCFLNPQRSVSRKIKELILAIEIEELYTKDKILETYLNEIPYGGRSYGVESASEIFFGKPAIELSLSESALLAALPQSPTYYSPYGQNPDELLIRKDWVLKRMFEEGYITERQMSDAQAVEIVFNPRADSIKAPHFVMYVKEILADRYGEKLLEEGGLTITTTLDWEMQKAAEEVISSKAEYNKDKYNAGNAALVTIDPNTGEILAMVGSKDYFDLEADGNVNVTIRERQPGSAIKPLVYATAFQKEYGPATMLLDVKTDFGNEYAPNNYDGEFRGPISIRDALQGSINVPAVKTLAYAGVNETIDLAHKMGITTLNQSERYGLSLVLGGGEVTLLDLTSAYGVFATGGQKAKLMPVLKVEDSKGRVLEENSPESLKQVLDPEVAYLINDVLSDDAARAPFFGSGSMLTLPGRVVAAKTGTTDLYRDGWTIGYTPDLVTGVWTGNNMGELMNKAGGLSVAAPIWNGYMRKVLAGEPSKSFTIPSGIRTVVVDALSGKLPSEATPETKTEVFSSWSVPTVEDNIHKKIVVVKNAPNRLPPSNFPEELTEEKIFAELHSERPKNSAWENPVIEWALEHNYNNIPNQIYDGPLDVPDNKEIKIISPIDGSTMDGDFFITAKIQDGLEVDEVSFFYDHALIAKLEVAPWRVKVESIELDDKTHSITVKLLKKDGIVVENSVYIKAGNIADKLVITMPDITAQSYPVSLVAQLTDRGKTLDIDKVEIYFDGTKRETFLPNSSGVYTTIIREGLKGQHTTWAKVISKSDKEYESNKINISIK